MHSEGTRGHLTDILRDIELADQFVSGMSVKEFGHDVRTTYAVIRCLEVISEASRRLPDTLKHRQRHVPWRDIAGAGNVYRHDYDGVSPERIWQTVKDFLPALRQVVMMEIEL